MEATQLVEEAEGEYEWAEVTTDDGQTYYRNAVTDVTSRTRPEMGMMNNTPTSLVMRDEGSADPSNEL